MIALREEAFGLTSTDVIRQNRTTLGDQLVTPRDFKSYYRILNRSMYTRNLQREAKSTLCRLCGCHLERYSHIAKCREVLKPFRKLCGLARTHVPGVQPDGAFVSLGLGPERVLPGSLSSLHMMLWKFVVIAFTQVDTKGAKWDANAVWRQALLRLESRVVRMGESVRRRMLRRRSQGEDGDGAHERAVEKWNKVVAPLASFDKEGTLKWDPNALRLIELARSRRRL